MSTRQPLLASPSRTLSQQAWQFDATPLLAAQCTLIRQNMVVGQAASIPAALMVALVHQHLYADSSIWNWAFISCVIDLMCIGLVRYTRDPVTPDEARVMAQVLRVMALFIGGMWGALALFFIQPDQPHSIMLVLAMLAGISSSGMIVFAPAWPVSLAHLLPVCVPPVWVLLQGDPAAMGIGVGTCIYLATMLPVSHRTAQTVREALALRFANDQLVNRLRDQTQRALEAREQTESALHEAEEANRAKVVFMAAASHDLRQPLHALGLFASTLARTPMSAHQRHLLNQIEQSGQAARELLSTLLDFSQVDTGVVKSSAEVFALQPLLRRLESEFAPQADAQQLHYRSRDCAWAVHADPALVERIMRNLITNALRYTERGGVLLGCRQRGARAVVEVWDTGIGIPEAQHREIFREFHQLGNPERDRRKGLGLGLSIVDGLARAMGVEVGLASREGRGSVFRLSLPISQAAVIAAERAAEPGGDLRGLHVLLIEDDESVLAAMSDLLINWGCACEMAASVDEAVARLGAFTPHLLLVDYRLRDHRSGIEAVSLIRERLGPELPAILVTGDTGPQRLREAHASGLILLHKPVPAERLHGALLSQWRRAQGATAGRASAAG